MSLPSPRLYSPYKDKQFLPEIIQIHADCILYDQQLAMFMPPLSHTRMQDYWRSMSEDIEKNRRVMILQFAAEDEVAVAGYVLLTLPTMEVAPFHGEVVHLMVSPKHRKKGVARRVMETLESVAKDREVKLLVGCRNSCSGF